MTNLKKWFPFKFQRKDKQEPPVAETQAQPETMVWPFASMPGHVGQWMRGLWGDQRWRDPLTLRGDLDRFFGDFAPSRFQPSIDVVDQGSHMAVSVELPGLDRKDIQLHVEQGTLTIAGEKHHEKTSDEDGCYRTERYFGSFHRSIPLPQDIDSEQAEAVFEKGVLTVRFPKTEAASTARKIEVR